MRILLAIVVLLPQLALAEVFKCVDPVTGNKVFTDVACDQNSSGESVRVVPGNFGASGHGAARSNQQRAWVSQDQTRGEGKSHTAASIRATERARELDVSQTDSAGG